MRALLALLAIVSIVRPSAARAQDAEGPAPEVVEGGASLSVPGTVAPGTAAPDAAGDDDGDESDRGEESEESDDERTQRELAELALEPERARLLDHRFGEARDGRSERLHGWASVGIFGGSITPAAPLVSLATRLDSADATVIAPSLGARLAMTRELDASVEWGFAYGATRVRGAYVDRSGEAPFDESREAVEAGNPVMQLAFTHDWSVLSVQVGLGAALPVAALAQAATDVPTAGDRAASLLVHELMLAMHGGIDPWRFFPERLSVVLPVRIAVGDRLGGAVEVVGAWTIPVLGSARDSAHEGALQIAGDVSYEIIPELRIGVRGSVVGWRLGRPDGPARAQGALEPWLRTTFGPVFGVVRATLDLAGDYGLGTGAGVWAIHVGGGGSLEAF